MHLAGGYLNYGLALNALGRRAEADEAWVVAMEIDPQIIAPEKARAIRNRYELRRGTRR